MAYEDLLKDTSQPSTSGTDKFIVTITDLAVNTLYPVQFRWKYSDGTFGLWGGTKVLVTPSEQSPATPSKLTVVGGSGFFTVTWDGKSSSNTEIANIDRIDIYVDGAPFDSTKPADTMIVAGTKTISASAGTYIVSAFAISKSGTKSAFAEPTFVDVTEVNGVIIEPPDQPSVPTVSSILGAIQVSWNGKTSDGSDQPLGFDAAKVYVGTTSTFTPSSLNQVDVLNFANGQNTLNIGVGTLADGVALTYDTDYFIKIATTNGTEDSVAVSATGNPVRLGKVQSGDIFSVSAAKITAGTLQANAKIVVGAETGKRVELNASGTTPFAIYGSGGTKLFDYNQTSEKLTIVGDGSFSGDLSIGSSNAIFKAEPATGIWLGNSAYASAPFSVSTNGVIKAEAGKVGGWTITENYLKSGTLEFNSLNSAIYVGATNADHIKISASGGIQHVNSSGSPTGKFNLTSSGLSVSGSISGGTISGAEIIGSTIRSNSASYVKIDSLNRPGTIDFIANGYGVPGYIDFTGAEGDVFGTLTLVPPTNDDATSPWISLFSNSTTNSVIINSTGTGEIQLNAWEVSGGTLSLAGAIYTTLDTSGWSMDGDISKTSSIRPISFGTNTSPSAARVAAWVGEVYLQYT
jgi:hypothetical protein